MIKVFMQKWWTTYYDVDAVSLLATLDDMFFQSNPFTYVTDSWAAPQYHLAVFQEATPNRMIYRDPLSSGLLEYCYGVKAYSRISQNPVLTSGAVIGIRDAILVYVSLEKRMCVLTTLYTIYLLL